MYLALLRQNDKQGSNRMKYLNIEKGTEYCTTLRVLAIAKFVYPPILFCLYIKSHDSIYYTFIENVE